MNDEALEKLILDGAAEFAGLSESGEMLYSFTPVLKEVDPVLYEEMIAIQRQELLFLWTKGFISMDITDKDPMVTVTDKALNNAEVEELPEHFRSMIREIVKALSNGGQQ
jgi:hypothetical protein